MDDLCPQIPFLEITKDSCKNHLRVTPHNYEWHDNAGRMPFLCHYLSTCVLPRMDKDAVSSIASKRYFPLELHDSYSYLVEEGYHDATTVNDAYEKGDMLSFARRKGHTSVVLLPDVYFMSDWGGAGYSCGVEDTIGFRHKPLDSVVFYGSSTGGRSPERNRRFEWCRWARHVNNDYEFKLTRLVQMPKDVIVHDWEEIHCPHHVPPSRQTRHKFIMNIEGNTCRYDVWPLATKSLVFIDKDAKDELVYHHELKDKEHWVEVDMNDIEKMRQYYIHNPTEAEHIVQNANLACTRLFSPSKCVQHAMNALVTSASN